jgi:hypothetical protein
VIGSRYDWPSITTDIRAVLNACDVCTQDMPGRTLKAGCKPYITTARFERWCMDVFDVGVSPSDMHLAVILVECFTKYATRTNNTKHKLHELMLRSVKFYETRNWFVS